MTEQSIANIDDLQKEIQSESIAVEDRQIANDPNILDEVVLSSPQALTGKQSGMTIGSMERIKGDSSETDRSEQVIAKVKHQMPSSKNQMKT